MKAAFAILAASLCIVAAAAIPIPQQPEQQGAALNLNGGAAVDRKLLHGGGDYDYDWHHYSSYDEEVYKAAKFAIKVLSKSKYLLKTLFGSYYHEESKPHYVELLDAYYYVDRHHNKYYKLTIKFEYYHQYYTYDFIVYAPYYNHYYIPKYLYKIIYNNKYVQGKWWY